MRLEGDRAKCPKKQSRLTQFSCHLFISPHKRVDSSWPASIVSETGQRFELPQSGPEPRLTMLQCRHCAILKGDTADTVTVNTDLLKTPSFKLSGD